MQTNPPKRAYNKKRILSQDELWKLIIPILWIDFIKYFLPDWVEQIDFSRKPDFLDKDLKRLMPKGKTKNRAVDMLMRVYLKNGKLATFLLHIEVQAYFEKLFTQRVFQYYYRISDFFQEPIETLVIMIDDNPDYRPNEHIEQFGKTKVHLMYRMFKLSDNPPPYPEDNIFSIVIEVAWHALKQNKLKTDDDLEVLKFKLIKRFLEKDIDDTTIYAMLSFINIYLPFENPEKDHIFGEKLDNLIFKDNIMEAISIKDYIIQKLEAQAEQRIKREVRKAKIKMREEIREEMREEMQEAVQEAEKKAAREAVNQAREAEKVISTAVLNLHDKGYSVEAIADIMSKPLNYVAHIISQK